MPPTNRLLDHYLPPQEGFFLESLVATTYQVDFEFVEEELLPIALGVRAPTSRMRAFRSELERRLQRTAVTILYDLSGCERLARLSPRIDALPISARKLHAKVTVQLWARPAAGGKGPPDRRLRLVIGSANLTRQGFRENYECVAAVEYGGPGSGPVNLLHDALVFLQEVGGETASEQLRQQLTLMRAEAAKLPIGEGGEEAPVQVVRAQQVVPALKEHWAALSADPPATIHIVSPFWPEGGEAEVLSGLVVRLGVPRRVELICRGVLAPDGRSWLPEFDGQIAGMLRQRLGCPLFLRASRSNHGVLPASKPDTGDVTEDEEIARELSGSATSTHEVQRSLHAKMIALSGPKGVVLYIGSSNCTRRGLALGGPANLEAGFVYRLGPRRDVVNGLLAFTDQAIEVLPHTPTPTQQPERRASPSVVPWFLSDVSVAGTQVTLRFKEGEPVPADLRVLMEDVAVREERRYWLLYRAADHPTPVVEETVDLLRCLRYDDLETLLVGERSEKAVPHVQVEVRWESLSIPFPVRFENKLDLPLLLLGRKPSEGELIDYFLFGREPAEAEGGEGEQSAGSGEALGRSDDPLDTRHILTYFMRRFVQAIPGIEAEIERSAYSRRALEASLCGPTSPLALAEHAADSLGRSPTSDEPRKTATAVGFQLVEILAVLIRSRLRIQDPELRDCFTPVINRCRALLDALAMTHAELRDDGFRRYRTLIGEEP